MKKWLVSCAALVAFALQAGSAVAAPNINGMTIVPRVFNDFSTSSFTGTNNYPTSVVLDDRNLTDDGTGGNFANRHDALFSADGGATPATFDINDGFTVSAIVKLDVGSVSPRKEAGIRINSPVTGDALFIVNSDAGEIVAFGAGAQFYSFSGGPQPDYVPGTEILLGLKYSGGNSSPRTVQYFIDRDPSTPGGIEFATGGPFAWSNLENGPTVFNVGFYGQVSPANANDFMTATFRNPTLTPIPEPATIVLGAIGLLAMVGMARRRS